jgi:hypothetical protein
MAGPRLLDDILLADNESGSDVLNVRRGVYFELDRSATEVVRLVQSLGPAGAAETLAARYGKPVALVRADVEHVLAVMSGTLASPTSRVRHPTRRGTVSVVRGWLHLTSKVKLDVMYATALVMVIEVLLRSQSVDRASRWLKAPLFDGNEGSDWPPLDLSGLTERERRLLGALAWVQRAWLFDGTCLRRALAAGWVLRRRRPHLCLGLTGSQEVLAHAWLVLEGCSLDGLPGAPMFRRGEHRGGAGQLG